MAAPVLSQLAWTLLLCLTSGRPSTASPAEEVQQPFNLTVNSYNFNTTLHWDYNRMEMPAYFCVDILDKVEFNWMAIEDCQNISHHYCDLSHKIFESISYYKVRVKALVGSKTSTPASIEFSLSSVGILGPPELDLFIEEKIIVVDIFHPKMPIDKFMEHGQLNYMVYCGNDSKEATECDNKVCTAEFSISQNGNYCFSAQGVSNYFIGMTMEKSKEKCIDVAEDIHPQTVGIIIGVIVGFLAICAISCFIVTRWTKARARMPQSLSSVVRNIVSYVQMPTQEMPRYNNVSTSPIESPIEEKMYVEKKVKIDTDVSTNSVSKESADAGYQSCLTENEQKTDEKGEDQSNSSSYFHTDSSTSGFISSDTSESEKDEKISEHVPETPTGLRPLSNSFGYDKPHFPKELI